MPKVIITVVLVGALMAPGCAGQRAEQVSQARQTAEIHDEPERETKTDAAPMQDMTFFDKAGTIALTPVFWVARLLMYPIDFLYTLSGIKC